jgi:hypothetical protein
MNKDQRDELARVLGTGKVIVRKPGYPEPFLLTVPFIPFDDTVTDNEVLDRYEKFIPELFTDPQDRAMILDAIRRQRGLPAKAAGLLQHSRQTAHQTPRQQQSKDAKQPGENSSSETSKAGSIDALRPLRIQLSKPNPFLTESEIFEAADIKSGSTKAASKHWLIEHGFIRVYKIQRRKSFLSVWEPLEKAYVQFGLAKPQYASKGGYPHQFAARRIKNFLVRQGYDVTLEYMLPDTGKAVDLWARRDDETMAWEIAISPPMSKEIENLVKDFSSSTKPDRVVIATVDSKMRRELEALIAGELWLSAYRNVISLTLIGDCIA